MSSFWSPFVEHLYLRMERRGTPQAWDGGRGQVVPCSMSSRDLYPTLWRSRRKRHNPRGKCQQGAPGNAGPWALRVQAVAKSLGPHTRRESRALPDFPHAGLTVSGQWCHGGQEWRDIDPFSVHRMRRITRLKSSPIQRDEDLDSN